MSDSTLSFFTKHVTQAGEGNKVRNSGSVFCQTPKATYLDFTDDDKGFCKVCCSSTITKTWQVWQWFVNVYKYLDNLLCA